MRPHLIVLTQHTSATFLEGRISHLHRSMAALTSGSSSLARLCKETVMERPKSCGITVSMRGFISSGLSRARSERSLLLQTDLKIVDRKSIVRMGRRTTCLYQVQLGGQSLPPLIASKMGIVLAVPTCSVGKLARDVLGMGAPCRLGQRK